MLTLRRLVFALTVANLVMVTARLYFDAAWVPEWWTGPGAMVLGGLQVVVLLQVLRDRNRL